MNEYKVTYLNNVNFMLSRIFNKVAYNGSEYKKWREKRFVVPSGNLKP